MLSDFRRFEAGPDPFGRVWQIEFLWIQNAISIRGADAVDVKFRMRCGGEEAEKVIAMAHPSLLALSRRAGRPITDPWCSRLAALHLRSMVESGEDMEKTLVSVSSAALERNHHALEQTAPTPA